jgi:outer membrane protein assembly factor BamB
VKSLWVHSTGGLWRSVGARGLVPLVICAMLAASIWQGTQFEIRPAEERTRFLLADPRPGVNDWPGWRGPTQDGVVTGEFLPPPNESHGWPDRWRCQLDGACSGLCVWGERVFVVATDRAHRTLELVGIHRLNGTVEWRTPLTTIEGDKSRMAAIGTTPVCDGERVFVPMIERGELWMVAVHVTGRVLWKQPVGPAKGSGLPAASPALSGSLVIVSCDQDGQSWLPGNPRSYLAGLHRQTGAVVYRIARPNGDGTPLIAEIAGRNQCVLNGRHGIASYDPASGTELWRVRWKAPRTTGTVAVDTEHVYAIGGDGDSEVLCIRADGDGDVTSSHVVWRERRPGHKLLAPVVTQHALILLTRDGSVTAVNRGTGKPMWQRRSLGGCTLPPYRVGTDGVCIVTDDGQIALLNADRRGESLWEAVLGSPIMSPPAFSQGQILLRTSDGVRSLGGTTTDTLVQQPPPGAKS